jgi:hypothetical protein
LYFEGAFHFLFVSVAEFCHNAHNGVGKSRNFNFETEFLESGKSPITKITTYHSNSQWDPSVLLSG